jgi:hypothetical protein
LENDVFRGIFFPSDPHGLIFITKAITKNIVARPEPKEKAAGEERRLLLAFERGGS